MKRLALVTALTAVVLIPACTTSMSLSDARSISERDGILYLDDVPLPHHREVSVEGILETGSLLFMRTALGAIDVSGVPGSNVNLTIDLYSEYEGDGEVQIDGEEITTFSNVRGKLLVNGIRGTIPEGTSLRVHSSTGEISLAGFAGESSIRIASGTGEIRMSNCGINDLDINTGTGNIFLDQVQIDDLLISSGTGDLSAEGSSFRTLRGTSGTGSFKLRGSSVVQARIESGTGDLVLVDSTVSERFESLGTGDVVIKSSQD